MPRKRNLKSRRKRGGVTPQNDDSDRAEYFCNICSSQRLVFTDIQYYNIHINGVDHKARLRRLRRHQEQQRIEAERRINEQSVAAVASPARSSYQDTIKTTNSEDTLDSSSLPSPAPLHDDDNDGDGGGATNNADDEDAATIKNVDRENPPSPPQMDTTTNTSFPSSFPSPRGVKTRSGQRRSTQHFLLSDRSRSGCQEQQRRRQQQRR